jgi:hypothetical protein
VIQPHKLATKPIGKTHRFYRREPGGEADCEGWEYYVETHHEGELYSREQDHIEMHRNLP